MDVSEIIWTISLPPEETTRQLEVTSKKQIQDMCVTVSPCFLYKLGEFK